MRAAFDPQGEGKGLRGLNCQTEAAALLSALGASATTTCCAERPRRKGVPVRKMRGFLPSW